MRTNQRRHADLRDLWAALSTPGQRKTARALMAAVHTRDRSTLERDLRTLADLGYVRLGPGAGWRRGAAAITVLVPFVAARRPTKDADR